MSENVESVLPIGGADGRATDLRRSFRNGGQGDVTEAMAIGMLQDCMRFLWQVVMITSEVAGSVNLDSFRKIVAADCAAPGTVIGGDGKPFTAEPVPDQGKRGPRGARHPLMVLMSQATTAVKLLRQIIRGVFPGAVGELSMLDKFDEQMRLINARADRKLF